MIEIFIPTKIKTPKSESFLIDNSPWKVTEIIEKNFGLNISNFNSNFFEWVYIYWDDFDPDIAILLNWQFWNYYFIDYDYLKYREVEISGTKIIKIDELSKSLSDIFWNISSIITELNSKNLLTNTKKDEIKTKITNSFFSISWVIFVLYRLLKKIQENKEMLENYTWEVQYEWQAKLINETNITKEIEIKAMIEKLENRTELFVESVGRIV
jgi:hypothetical protein